jgi:hypothetical protein
MELLPVTSSLAGFVANFLEHSVRLSPPPMNRVLALRHGRVFDLLNKLGRAYLLKLPGLLLIRRLIRSSKKEGRKGGREKDDCYSTTSKK